MNNLPTPIAFDTALDKFVTNLRIEKRSSATVTAYAGDLNQLKNFLDKQRITQATTVQTEHLQSFLDSLGNLGYTAKSISRKINSIKTFFKFLNQKGLTTVNPSTPLVHPKYETAPPRVLTVDEYKRLRDAYRLDIRMSAIVELLLQTGIRISELANLRLVDIKKNELVVRALENNAQRIVPLSKTGAAAVHNYLAIRPQASDDHLFVTKTGKPLLVRNIRTAVDRYFKAAGIKGGKVNDLRHTFIAHQLQSGVNPEFLAKIVGHKRLTSTEKYLDIVTPSTQVSTKLVEL